MFAFPPTSAPSATPSLLPSRFPSRTPSRSPSKTLSSRSPSETPSLMPSPAPSENAPTTTPSPSGCHPSFGGSIKECSSRIKACRDQRILMKWSGKGCRGKHGVALGDGGCQCVGYCGYQCKSACNRDKTCRWKQKRCYVKATNQVGGPIPVCASLAAAG